MGPLNTPEKSHQHRFFRALIIVIFKYYIRKEELMDSSLDLYIHGKLTLEQAARQAEVTPWDLIDLMTQRGIHHRGTSEELRFEVRDRLREIGLKDLADEI
jgi:predicted HTH domain antitoxin